MNVTTFAYRSLNKVLAKLNLTLAVADKDFQAHLTDSADLDELFCALARPLDEWLRGQTVFEQSQALNCRVEVEQFYGEYMQSPFRVNSGGSRFNNLLWLYCVTKAFVPTVVVDSGTYKGASVWALQMAAPAAKIFSFDIDLSRLVKKCPGVEYIEEDWATYDFSSVDLSRGFCYFDDHLDQARRLLEARDRGFGLAVFDDDFPVTSFALMAHGGFSLPKIEFVLDGNLRGRESIGWIDGSRRHEWKIDSAYLDRARRAISRSERLPNTSLTTGIHQTPYRVVSIVTV